MYKRQLYARTDATHRVAAERLYELVHDWLSGEVGDEVADEVADELGDEVAEKRTPGGLEARSAHFQRTSCARDAIAQAIRADYEASGAHGRPAFLMRGLSGGRHRADLPGAPPRDAAIARQTRHLQNQPRRVLP